MYILEVYFQCRKLGLLAPEETLPDNCRKTFQQMWANTGDAISKQYAGTVALKVRKASLNTNTWHSCYSNKNLKNLKPRF